MKRLEGQIMKKRMLYNQIDRTEHHGFYTTAYPENPTRILGYEIFKIKVAKERLSTKGEVIEAHELYPNDEDFGYTAKAYHGLESRKRAIAAWKAVKPTSEITEEYLANQPVLA